MKVSLKPSRGYSLTELLVVVAIVGMLSLVAVPAFMNFSRTNSLQSGLRSFTADLRNCRQRAISRNTQVVLELNSSTTYSFWESTDSGVTFSAISSSGPTSWLPGTAQTKSLDKAIFFSSDTLTADINSKNGILFMPDGTARQATMSSTAPMTITLQTAWTNVSKNQFVVTVNSTGKITSVGSHT